MAGLTIFVIYHHWCKPPLTIRSALQFWHFNCTSRVPVKGKSSLCLICMTLRIILLIIIIISLVQIFTSWRQATPYCRLGFVGDALPITLRRGGLRPASRDHADQTSGTHYNTSLTLRETAQPNHTTPPFNPFFTFFCIFASFRLVRPLRHDRKRK